MMPSEHEKWFVESLKPSLWLQSLGISPFLPYEINDSDDWTFVIKWHTLIEAAASHFLSSRFKGDGLDEAFSRMPMSDTKCGKIVFLKSTGLFSNDEITFIRAFSELRNYVAHDIRNVSYSIKGAMDQMNPDKRKSLCKKYGFGIMAPSLNFNNITTSEGKLRCIENDPKLFIGIECLQLMEKLCKLAESPGLNAAAKAEWTRLVEEGKVESQVTPPI